MNRIQQRSRFGRTCISVDSVARQWERTWGLAGGLIRGAADEAVGYVDRLAQAHADALWERAFDDLGVHFERLAALVQAEYSLGWSTGGTWASDRDHPLHWWAEFGSYAIRTAPAREYVTAEEFLTAGFQGKAEAPAQITLQADVEHNAQTLRYRSSLSADKQVLVEGPAGAIDAPHGALGCYREIKAALGAIGLFIERSDHVIGAHLRKRS